LAVTAMVATNLYGELRDAEGLRRESTAEDLDALAEFRLPGAATMGRLRAYAAAMAARARRRRSDGLEQALLPVAEATARA
jgi:hypothetical protein